MNVQFCDPDRSSMPDGARSVRFWPGKTVGGIYVARYEAGSTLEYSELIVFSALARMAGRVGGWISHIYVDSEASVAGGQIIWGLPKERARFDWWDGELTVSYSGTPILFVTGLGGGSGFPLRGRAPAFGVREGTPIYFHAGFSARAKLCRARFRVAPESPFSIMALGRGWSIRLDALDAVVNRPEVVKSDGRTS